VHQHGFDLIVTGVGDEYCVGSNPCGTGSKAAVAHESTGLVDVARGGFGDHIGLFDGVCNTEPMCGLMHEFGLGRRLSASEAVIEMVQVKRTLGQVCCEGIEKRQ
jgi:hypothetical protein